MNPCKYCQNYGKSSPCACALGVEYATGIWGKDYTGNRLNWDTDPFGKDKVQIVVTTTATRTIYD